MGDLVLVKALLCSRNCFSRELCMYDIIFYIYHAFTDVNFFSTVFLCMNVFGFKFACMNLNQLPSPPPQKLYGPSLCPKLVS